MNKWVIIALAALATLYGIFLSLNNTYCSGMFMKEIAENCKSENILLLAIIVFVIICAYVIYLVVRDAKDNGYGN